ncbi:hypothetical protein B0H14DRAFT_3163150 [Mycena olivaceomarginata]|nr:hypothetical protein B0H14DRAFT_3163150 [Mycena olivaceomarginata]
MASLSHRGSSTKSEGALRVQLCVISASDLPGGKQVLASIWVPSLKKCWDTKVSPTAEWNHAIPFKLSQKELETDEDGIRKNLLRITSQLPSTTGSVNLARQQIADVARLCEMCNGTCVSSFPSILPPLSPTLPSLGATVHLRSQPIRPEFTCGSLLWRQQFLSTPLPNNSTTFLPTTSSSTPNAASDYSYVATYPSGNNPANKQGSIRFGALAAALIVVLLAVLLYTLLFFFSFLPPTQLISHAGLTDMEHPSASSTKPISRTPVLNERDKGVDCISMALRFLWNKILLKSLELGSEFVFQPEHRDLVGFGWEFILNRGRLRVIGLDQPTAFYLKVHNIIHAIATSEDPADAGGYWSGLARNSGVFNNSVTIAGEFTQQVVPLFPRGCGASKHNVITFYELILLFLKDLSAM